MHIVSTVSFQPCMIIVGAGMPAAIVIVVSLEQ